MSTLFGIGTCLLSANASVSHENLQQQSILLNPHWKLDCCLMTLGSRGVRSLPKHDLSWRWLKILARKDAPDQLGARGDTKRQAAFSGQEQVIEWLHCWRLHGAICIETNKFTCVFRAFQDLGGYCCCFLRFNSISEIWQEINLNPKPFQFLECCAESVFLGLTLYVVYWMWLVWFLKVSLLDGEGSLMWIFCQDFFMYPTGQFIVWQLTSDRLEQLDCFTSWDPAPL